MTTDVSLKLLLLGEDRGASRALRGVATNATTASTKAQKLHSHLKLVGAAFAGGFAYEGIQKGVEFLKSSVEAASKDQQATAILTQQIKNNTGATTEQAHSVEEWLTKTALATGHMKSELIPNYTRLVTVTHSTSKAQSLLKLAMDASAGTGKSLDTVTNALVKAQNGNVGSLSRLGVKTQSVAKDQGALMHAQLAVDEAQKKYNDTVKQYGPNSTEARLAQEKLTYAHEKYGEALQKTKKSTLSFTEIQKEMATQFKGDSARAADTAAGRFKRLGVLWEELKVQVGNFLIPILTSLAGFMIHTLVPVLEGVAQWVHRNSTLVKILVGITFSVIAAIKIFRLTMMALEAVLYANPIGIVIGLIAALAAGLVIAYHKSETFRKIVNTAFQIIASVAKWLWNNVLRPIFATWLDNFRYVWNAGQKLAGIMRNVWNAISTAFRTGIRFIVGIFLGMVGAILNGAAKAFGWVPKIGDKLRNAADAFNRFKDRVNNSLSGIHDQHVTVAVGTSFSQVMQKSTNILRGRLQKSPPKHAMGGHISGPGTGTSDSIPAMLSNGEFVVNARSTARHRALLEHINRQGYAAGGIVTGLPGSERRIANYAHSTNAFLGRYASALHRIQPNPIAAILGVAGQALSALTGGLGGAGSGVTRWIGVIRTALALLHQPQSLVGAVLHRMMQESGGNPTIPNLWDSNAKAGHPSVGLMQVIGPTFRAYAGRFRNVGPFEYGVSVNPLANVYAGLNYALHRYPSLAYAMLKPGGYRMGGRPRVGMPGIFGHGPEMWVPDRPGTVLTASQTARALAGQGGHLGTVTLELTLDGKVIQRRLLTLKRQNGGLALGLT